MPVELIRAGSNCAVFAFFLYNFNINYSIMKLLASFVAAASFAVLSCPQAHAQCATSAQLGSAINMFSILNNNSNPVAVNKDLNTVVFVHRHNPNTFGGNSGNLRYALSTNNGGTWTTNQGVLNPVSSSVARYPNAAIYNPAGNTNPSQQYLTYLAPTTTPPNWDGVVTGVRQLSGAGNTESYNQPGAPGYLVAVSLVKGAQGVYWALDRNSNGVTPTGPINVYRGVWNSNLNDIQWNINTTFNPSYNTSYSGARWMHAMKIAFDPTGSKGWICFMTHLNSGHPSPFGYYPVFYQTLNGGLSWSGPITLNLNALNCISSNVFGAAASDGDAGLVVDTLGNPHLLTIIGETDNNYGLDYNSWYHLFDITRVNSQWTALSVSSINGAPALLGGSQNSTAYHSMTPQAARNASGSKLFFGWTDNTGYFQGQDNILPDLFARGYDVGTNKWTPVKDFTSCNFGTSGSIFYPHLAEQVLEPSPGQFKLAPVYGDFTGSIDLDQPANFRFLDNCIFSSSDFSLSGSAAVSIAQGTAALLCPGSTLFLQLAGNYSQILWSNGPSGPVNPVTTPGNYFVTASNGCSTGSASIVVTTLTMSVSGASSLCAGGTATLTAGSNAASFTWSPGQQVANSITVMPTNSIVYTVTTTGTDNCQVKKTHNVTVSPIPVLVIQTSEEVSCAGDPVSLDVSGASSYVWSTGSAGATVIVNPVITSEYTVAGTSAGGCQSVQGFTQTVNECAGIRDREISLLTLVPNPAHNEVAIASGVSADLMLINNTGQVVWSGEVRAGEKLRLQISDFSKGIYYLTDCSGSGLKARRLVIE
jgi:hypothetical protein